MHRLRRRPASRTLFCGGFGRRFFCLCEGFCRSFLVYIVYFIFGSDDQKWDT
jgi:hypothetical protein